MIEIGNLTLLCPNCTCPFDKFQVGKRHVYATCDICNQRFEVGITYQYKP